MSLFLIVIGECIDSPGGFSISTSGNSAGSTSGQPPAFSYPPGSSFKAGNPSNYVVPIVKIPPHPNPSPNQQTTNNASNGTGIQKLYFSMTSDVKGNGSFALLSRMDGQENDDRTYQLISAPYGSLSQSRIMTYGKDSESTDTEEGSLNYSLDQINVKDSLLFVGQSYSDVTKLKNNANIIRDYTRAGAIAKDSAYGIQSFTATFDNITSLKELVNNYLAYKINTRFVGSSDLHAIANGSEIMQSYAGQIALNRTIGSQFKSNLTAYEDPVLGCCNQLIPFSPRRIFDPSELY
jgi:hypothetical protein